MKYEIGIQEEESMRSQETDWKLLAGRAIDILWAARIESPTLRIQLARLQCTFDSMERQEAKGSTEVPKARVNND